MCPNPVFGSVAGLLAGTAITGLEGDYDGVHAGSIGTRGLDLSRRTAAEVPLARAPIPDGRLFATKTGKGVGKVLTRRRRAA